MAEDSPERQRAQAARQVRGSGGKVVVLESDADHGKKGNDEEPEGVAVAFLTKEMVVVRDLEGRNGQSYWGK